MQANLKTSRAQELTNIVGNLLIKSEVAKLVPVPVVGVLVVVVVQVVVNGVEGATATAAVGTVVFVEVRLTFAHRLVRVHWVVEMMLICNEK